jgi:hypothetical protein
MALVTEPSILPRVWAIAGSVSLAGISKSFSGSAAPAGAASMTRGVRTIRARMAVSFRIILVIIGKRLSLGKA